MGTIRAIALAALVVWISPAAAKAPAHENPHKVLKRSCEKCHVATSFHDIRFDHATTGFPLEGRHAAARCLDCHNVEDFSRVESSCATCHEDIHRGRMGTRCDDCHRPDGWKVLDATEIHARSNAPVMGRHITLDCEGCHPGMPTADFRSAVTRCVVCHRADYDRTTNPAHAAGGFPTECEQCHEMTGWRPATMPDHEPFFPIFSGVHAGVWSGCATCHTTPGNFQTFSCLGCHEHEQPQMDPVHAGINGYSYDSPSCYSCHPRGTAGDFRQHDTLYFPIFSGTHQSTWTDCAACHPTPGNRADFTCLSCHDHAQPTMDGAHAGMNGYAYDSPTCLGCHPTGVAGKFLQHDALYFPIYSGTHQSAWTDCAACHPTPGNRADFTCLSCHEQPTMDGVHAGINGYAYDSPTCLGCHPTGVAGDFLQHDTLYFPIYSGSHVGRWTACSDCHPTPGNRADFTCLSCHAHSQSAMDSAHQGRSGYSYTSDACLSCHPSGRAGG